MSGCMFLFGAEIGCNFTQANHLLNFKALWTMELSAAHRKCLLRRAPPTQEETASIPQHNPPLLPFNQVATAQLLLLMTLDTRHCAVASHKVLQCLTKLLPKSVGSENIFSSMISLQCYFLGFWCEIHFCCSSSSAASMLFYSTTRLTVTFCISCFPSGPFKGSL